MKVYVVCDLEGTAGVVDYRRQCWFDGEYYRQARKMATAELNALVQGAIDGGATEVWAWDGHGNFPGGLDIELVHKDCKMVMGAGDGGPAGLDSTFDAAFHCGFHAMAGTSRAVLAHSFAPHVHEVRMNGLAVGEIGLNFACAGALGVPSVLICGDRAAVEEARGLVPEIVGVVIKEGLSVIPTGLKQQGPTLSLSPEESCRRIYEAAKVAVGKCSGIRPLVVEPPYTFRIAYYEAEHADALARSLPCSRRVDECSVEYEVSSLDGFRI